MVDGIENDMSKLDVNGESQFKLNVPLYNGSGDEATLKRCCTDLDASDFKTRIGPKYARNGLKENSSASLYDVLGADVCKNHHKSKDK